MAYATTIVIPDSSAANQSYNRVALGPNYAKYVNDTARAAGVEEFFELRSEEKKLKKSSPTVTTPMNRWNLKWYHKGNADVEPVTFSCTFSCPDSLSNAIATIRTIFKNGRAVFSSLSDTDAEVDDITDARTQ